MRVPRKATSVGQVGTQMEAVFFPSKLQCGPPRWNWFSLQLWNGWELIVDGTALCQTKNTTTEFICTLELPINRFDLVTCTFGVNPQCVKAKRISIHRPFVSVHSVRCGISAAFFPAHSKPAPSFTWRGLGLSAVVQIECTGMSLLKRATWRQLIVKLTVIFCSHYIQLTILHPQYTTDFLGFHRGCSPTSIHLTLVCLRLVGNVSGVAGYVHMRHINSFRLKWLLSRTRFGKLSITAGILWGLQQSAC